MSDTSDRHTAGPSESSDLGLVGESRRSIPFSSAATPAGKEWKEKSIPFSSTRPVTATPPATSAPATTPTATTPKPAAEPTK
jgi:hypothetical protein